MDNEWKNSLRERFSDYAAPEPEGLWEGIEQGLAGKPRRKMLPVWIVSGLAAAAAVALGVFLQPEKTPETPDLQRQATLAESVQAEPVDAVVEPAETTDDFGALTSSASEIAPGASTSSATGSKSVPFAVASRQTLLAEAGVVKANPVSPIDGMKTGFESITATVEMGEKLSKEELDACSQSMTEVALKKAAEQTGKDREEWTVIAVPDQVGHDGHAEQDDQVGHDNQGVLTGQVASRDMMPTNKRKRFSISAYGNGGQASSEQMQGYGMNRTGEYLGTRATGSNVKNDVSGLMRTLASNRASSFEAHHAAPLRVGVTAAWALTPHLSLVSGLNWTYLNSEFEETANPIRTVTSQDLGYLGVPLRLETAFNVWRGLWLSAGVGGMVETGLLSSSRTRTWVDGQVAEAVENPAPDMGGLLWSLGATAGAEYRYSPSFGIYFNPGIEYHFDNGAEVRSAYTEKPLHWNVNLGVRFHFGN